MATERFKLAGSNHEYCFTTTTYRSNNQEALVLVSYLEGNTDFTVISVAREQNPKFGRFWIKNYAEREELISLLLSAGLLEDSGERDQSGHVPIPSMNLTPKGMKYMSSKNNIN